MPETQREFLISQSVAGLADNEGASPRSFWEGLTSRQHFCMGDSRATDLVFIVKELHPITAPEHHQEAGNVTPFLFPFKLRHDRGSSPLDRCALYLGFDDIFIKHLSKRED